MDIYELIQDLVKIASIYGHKTIYIKEPSFTDGHYDGNSLQDYWSITIDDDETVILG